MKRERYKEKRGLTLYISRADPIFAAIGQVRQHLALCATIYTHTSPISVTISATLMADLGVGSSNHYYYWLEHVL
jgi:hypothetical protein